MPESPELQDSTKSRKRDHAAFEDAPGLSDAVFVPADLSGLGEERHLAEAAAVVAKDNNDTIDAYSGRASSPAQSTTSSVLTDARTTTPRLRTPSIGGGECGGSGTPCEQPLIPRNDGIISTSPPAKRAKLTVQEKELKKLSKEMRDKERADQKAKKEAVKAKNHAEKEAAKASAIEEKARKEAQREAEKEAAKRKKEKEKEEKRLAAEAAKEEKKRKKDEEKNKASKGQMKLTGFVKLPTSASTMNDATRERMTASPGPSSTLSAAHLADTPTKPTKTYYEKAFPEFFVQNGVKVAPFNYFERDEAALETMHRNLDSYIREIRSPANQRKFDARELFNLPSHESTIRGRRYMPVREIMTTFYPGKSSKVVDLTTDSQNMQIKQAGDVLSKIPIKFLKFQEDVRPPYRGTYTLQPKGGVSSIARNPFRKELPNTDYDYDSEAEWIEDEDAEDLKSEGDEDEEVEDDEDMDEFLDDENDDAINSRRMIVQGDLEPVSSGLCWEDGQRRNENVSMMKLRMENILDPTIHSIDPFSTAYWEPTPLANTTSMDPPRIPLNNLKTTSVSHNSLSSASSAAKVVKPFSASSVLQQNTHRPRGRPKTIDCSGKPKRLLPASEIPAFKDTIKEWDDMSKLGIIEVLKKKFGKQTAAVIKNTLEAVARRVGEKESEKRWVIVDEQGNGATGVDVLLGASANVVNS